MSTSKCNPRKKKNLAKRKRLTTRGSFSPHWSRREVALDIRHPRHACTQIAPHGLSGEKKINANKLLCVGWLCCLWCGLP